MRNRRGFTVLEIVIGMALGLTVIQIAISGVNALTRESSRAFQALNQTQQALCFLETVRVELSSMVLNPFEDAAELEGNSFLLSRPNGTSIQFITRRREGDRLARYLVYYEARNRASGNPAASGLTLRKRVWKFNQDTPWYEPITFGPGWPAEWIGPLVEDESAKFKDLDLLDLRWNFLVPEENEGRVFFRLSMVLRAAGGRRSLPFTTLVSVATPDLPTTVSDAPCLFASCFDPSQPDVNCCTQGEDP